MPGPAHASGAGRGPTRGRARAAALGIVSSVVLTLLVLPPAGAGNPPMEGRVVSVRIKSVTVLKHAKREWVGADVIVLAADGAEGDWAATAAALADAAVALAPADFVKIDLRDAAVADLAVSDGYKHLAIAYVAKNPHKSPWPDDPWAVYPSKRRTDPAEAARIGAYERLRATLLDQTRDPPRAAREAAAAVARSSGLPAWEPPRENQDQGTSLHRREALRILGTVSPPALQELTECLRDPGGRDRWGCER